MSDLWEWIKFWNDPDDTARVSDDDLTSEERRLLPDSEHPTGLCPRCGVQSSFDVRDAGPVSWDHRIEVVADDVNPGEPLDTQRLSVLVCRSCKQGVVVVEQMYDVKPTDAHISSGRKISHKGIHWWPLPAADLPKTVPGDIADSFAEAVRSLSGNCARAASVMARRTLEVIASNKGAKGKDLSQRLQNLAQNGLLPPMLAEMAKEVRLVANVGAHYDPVQHVSRQDAWDLIEFVREVIKYLYEFPAKLEKRRNPEP